jgi:hypothetical protein
MQDISVLEVYYLSITAWADINLTSLHKYLHI